MFVKKIGTIAGGLIVLALVTPAGGLSAAHENDPKKEPEPVTLEGYAGEVLSVCFSPDGKRILTGGGVSDVRGGAGGARPGAVPPVGKATGTGEVKMWDVEKKIELRAFKGHTDRVWCVCFSPDGKRIASASLDQSVRVWDAVKGQELLSLKGHTSFVLGVCFSPDGKRLASASADRTIRVWDAEKGQELLSLTGHTSNVNSICFSPGV